jgi:hypothetical protein
MLGRPLQNCDATTSSSNQFSPPEKQQPPSAIGLPCFCRCLIAQPSVCYWAWASGGASLCAERSSPWWRESLAAARALRVQARRSRYRCGGSWPPGSRGWRILSPLERMDGRSRRIRLWSMTCRSKATASLECAWPPQALWRTAFGLAPPVAADPIVKRQRCTWSRLTYSWQACEQECKTAVETQASRLSSSSVWSARDAVKTGQIPETWSPASNLGLRSILIFEHDLFCSISAHVLVYELRSLRILEDIRITFLCVDLFEGQEKIYLILD